MRRSILLPLGGCLLLLVVGAAIGSYNLERERASEASRARALLAEAVDAADRKKALEKLSRQIAGDLLGGASSPSEIQKRLQELLSGVPREAASILLFDGRARLVFPLSASLPAEVSPGASYLYLQRDFLDRGETTPAFDEAGRLFGGPGWPNLVARPRVLESNMHAEQERWIWWDAVPAPADPDRVAGLIILYRISRLTPEILLQAAIRRFAERGETVSVYDRLQPERSDSPARFPPAFLADLAERYFATPSDLVEMNGETFCVAPCLGNLLLFTALRLPQATFPAWVWPAILAWICVCFLTLSSETQASERLPLAWLLTLLIGISAGLPFLLSVAMWLGMERDRTEAITREAIADLQGRLVAIDLGFPTIRREYLRLFATWTQKFEREWLRVGEAPPLEPPDASPFYRMFKPDSRLEALLEETRQLELDGRLDTVYLIASTGRLFRESSGIPVDCRLIALRPWKERVEIMRSWHRRDGYRSFGKLWLACQAPASGADRGSFLRSAQENEQGAMVFARLGTAATAQYNAWKGLAGPKDGEEASTMLLQSMLDEQGENMIPRLLSWPRDLTTLGRDDPTAVYIDVIHGRKGGADFLFLPLLRSPMLGRCYFERVLTPRRALPVTGDAPPEPRFSAMLRSNRNGFDVPDSSVRSEFGELEKRLSISQQLIGEIQPTASGPRLLAAYLCNQAWGYILVGTQPFSEVAGRIAALRIRLACLGAMMALILATLVWRLLSGVALPVRALMGGIEAMERKDLDHVITLRTRDEWETMAGTFNEAILGLEELDSARAIQEKLLPAKPVEAAGFRCTGRSIMSTQIGGDFYDARVAADGSLAFVIADVSGHGTASALVTAMAKAAFGFFIRDGLDKPDEILSRMNPLFLSILRRTKNMSCLLGFARPDGIVTIANAGHCYPFLLSADGKATQFEDLAAFPLGSSAKGKYKSMSFPMAPGEHLVLFTDGIPEGVDQAEDPFGYTRLGDLLGRARRSQPVDLIDDVLAGLRGHTGNMPWNDDVTISIITREMKKMRDAKE